MTSKSEGCEAFAKLLHNLLLRRSPSKAAILHTCTHSRVNSFSRFFFGLTFEKNNSSKTPAETHSRHTHTRVTQKLIRHRSTRVFFFSSCSTSIFSLFRSHTFQLSLRTPLRCGRQLEKKKKSLILL